MIKLLEDKGFIHEPTLTKSTNPIILSQKPPMGGEFYRYQGTSCYQWYELVRYSWHPHGQIIVITGKDLKALNEDVTL